MYILCINFHRAMEKKTNKNKTKKTLFYGRTDIGSVHWDFLFLGFFFFSQPKFSDFGQKQLILQDFGKIRRKKSPKMEKRWANCTHKTGLFFVCLFFSLPTLEMFMISNLHDLFILHNLCHTKSDYITEFCKLFSILGLHEAKLTSNVLCIKYTMNKTLSPLAQMLKMTHRSYNCINSQNLR